MVDGGGASKQRRGAWGKGQGSTQRLGKRETTDLEHGEGSPLNLPPHISPLNGVYFLVLDFCWRGPSKHGSSKRGIEFPQPPWIGRGMGSSSSLLREFRLPARRSCPAGPVAHRGCWPASARLLASEFRAPALRGACASRTPCRAGAALPRCVVLGRGILLTKPMEFCGDMIGRDAIGPSNDCPSPGRASNPPRPLTSHSSSPLKFNAKIEPIGFSAIWSESEAMFGAKGPGPVLMSGALLGGHVRVRRTAHGLPFRGHLTAQGSLGLAADATLASTPASNLDGLVRHARTKQTPHTSPTLSSGNALVKTLHN